MAYKMVSMKIKESDIKRFRLAMSVEGYENFSEWMRALGRRHCDQVLGKEVAVEVVELPVEQPRGFHVDPVEAQDPVVEAPPFHQSQYEEPEPHGEDVILANKEYCVICRGYGKTMPSGARVEDGDDKTRAIMCTRCDGTGFEPN